MVKGQIRIEMTVCWAPAEVISWVKIFSTGQVEGLCADIK
jgi:hypothetical protein